MADNERLQQEQMELLAIDHRFVKTYDSINDDDRLSVGGKALNLAIMAQRGITVPEGICITTDAHDAYVQSGSIDRDLVDKLEDFRAACGGQIAVRSSATCEDGSDLSMAGVFDTHYLIDPDQDVETAMAAIYEQARSKKVSDFLALHGREDEEPKMGIVVQRLITPERSGVLYTGINGGHLLAQYVEGFGSDLVDGLEEGSSIVIDYAGTIIQSKGFAAKPIPGEQLTLLADNAKKIERIFADEPQDIEFASENGNLYILQARPLTAEIGDVQLLETPTETLHAVKSRLLELVQTEKAEFGSERVIFTDSNFSELLPRPKEMDLGIFTYIFTGSDGIAGSIQLGRKEMGYPLGDESIGYMHLVGGKPYFSLARDAHTFFAGFPSTRSEYTETLVAEYLEAVEEQPSLGEYPEMKLYLQDPTLEDLRLRFGDKAESYFETYLSFRERLAGYADTFLSEYQTQRLPAEIEYLAAMSAVELKELDTSELESYMFDVLEHLRTESCVDFVKAARLGFYYSQRLQNFLQQELEIDSDESEILFTKLSQGLEGSAITNANLAIANAGSFEEALAIGKEKVGHYSVGEMLEIRHPRLNEASESLRTYVAGIYENRDRYIGEFSQQKAERLATEEEVLEKLDPKKQEQFRHILGASQKYMALRETVKYHFVAEYALVRNTLVQLSEKINIAPEDIFSLYPREIPQFIRNTSDFRPIIQERQQAFTNYIHLEMPSVIQESDIAQLDLVKDDNGLTTEMSGRLLAQGKAIDEGVVVNIDDHEDPEAALRTIRAARHVGLRVVLAASQMNLSHDPLIVIADGIVIENAGLVSHGAQRARELGRGAIGGIKSRHLKTGDMISFDPAERKIIKLEQI